MVSNSRRQQSLQLLERVQADGGFMLRMRLLIGIPMVAVFLFIVWIDTAFFNSWFPLWLVTMVVTMTLGAREITDILQSSTIRPASDLVIGGVLSITLSNWAPHQSNTFLSDNPLSAHAIHAFAWPFITFIAVTMTSFVVLSFRSNHLGDTLATLSGTILAITYVGLLGSFLIQFRWIGSQHGLVPLVALVATAKGSDAGAYFLGRYAGKRQLWPRLSPNKTIEGAVGGLLFGVGAALSVFGIAILGLHRTNISWVEACGFGLVVGAAAQFGDLMESMIKRSCHRKDASATLPGFGGVLDVLDSLLFAGPVAYAYWLLCGI